ncbi:MAG: PKD domain-containing protein [Candidatus Diapherotrites archaeon]
MKPRNMQFVKETIHFGLFTFFIVYLVSFVFSYASCVNGINATELAYGSNGQISQISGYANGIIKEFRLPVVWGQYNLYQRICVGGELAFSEAESGFKITFTQNDVPLQQIPSYLTLAHGIAIDPPTGEDLPQPGEDKNNFRKNEWINEGANHDSPPIINVSTSFITKLCNKGQKKYNCSNYGNNKLCTVQADYSTPQSFTTKKEKISSIPSTYIASNGYDAYVIPFGGLKTVAFGGTQLFRAMEIALDCKVSCDGPLEPKNASARVHKLTIQKETAESGKDSFYIDLDEAAQKCAGGTDTYVGCYTNEGAHFLYIDKIFFPDTMESVEADWLIRMYSSKYQGKSEPKLLFQLPLVAATGTPPLVNFEYNFDGVTGEEILVNFTPEVSDPDGQIKSLTWNFGDGKKHVLKQQPTSVTYGFKPGYYTVSLTVYDNDGLKAKKVRTIKVEG